MLQNFRQTFKMTPEELIHKYNNFDRLTLQLCNLDYDKKTNSYIHVDFSTLPPDWICQAQHRGRKLAPCVAGESGFTFLTKKGFKALTPLIKEMVKDDWPAFEKKVAKHFEDMETGRIARQKLFERKARLYKEFVV